MAVIFLSYHPDSEALAGRIDGLLLARYGWGTSFHEFSSLSRNLPRQAAVSELIEECRVMLVLLDKNWLDALFALSDAEFRSQAKFPLLDVKLALERGLDIVTVRVKGGGLPVGGESPEATMRKLQQAPSVRLDEEDFEQGMLELNGRLTSAIGRAYAAAPPPGSPAQAPRGSGVGSSIAGALGRISHAIGDTLDRVRGMTRGKPPAAPSDRAAEPPSPPVDSGPAGKPAPPPAAPPPPPPPAAPPRQESPSEKLERARAPRVHIPYDLAGEDTEYPTMSGAEPASASPESAPRDPVLLGASAPQTVKPGDEFTARLVAYLKAQAGEVEKELGRLSPRASSHLGLKACQWQRGTEVSVKLAARGLEVTPAEQQFVWDGERVIVEFDVTMPEAAAEGSVVLKFDVAIAGINVAWLRLDLAIAAREANTGAAFSLTTSAVTSAARSAFASYSSKDRERVLDRVAAVRISAGLDIFLDCLSLHPSEEWKPQLDREIRGRDLFLLFWSDEAAASRWVTWEWQTALQSKGKQAMQIHPLQPGVKPPEELKDLHFGDVFMLIREGYRASTAPRSTQ